MINFSYPYGATPLDPDEIEGLIPSHIATHAQLNDWEQQNILYAENIYGGRQFPYQEILDISFVQKIHAEMFGKTWRWTGKFRKTEKSIGIDPIRISVALRNLLDDVKFQFDHETYPIDEAVARFHHRLVWIHLFPNGNGRHARFIADLVRK